MAYFKDNNFDNGIKFSMNWATNLIRDEMFWSEIEKGPKRYDNRVESTWLETRVAQLPFRRDVWRKKAEKTPAFTIDLFWT